MPMFAQMAGMPDSAEVVTTLGLEGRILQASTGAGALEGVVGWDQKPALAGELGSRGGWRITSTILGGGGNKGFMSPMS